MNFHLFCNGNFAGGIYFDRICAQSFPKIRYSFQHCNLGEGGIYFEHWRYAQAGKNLLRVAAPPLIFNFQSQEKLFYPGRCLKINANFCSGKICPSRKCCYIFFGAKFCVGWRSSQPRWCQPMMPGRPGIIAWHHRGLKFSLMFWTFRWCQVRFWQ